MFCEAVAVTV